MTRTTLTVLLLTAAPAAHAQTPADGWSGQVQCVLSVRGIGYQDDQTHTWVLSGAPVIRNNFRDYTATWTVSGSGSRTLIAQRAAAAGGVDSWTRSGSDAGAQITVFVPVGTTTLRISPGQRTVKAVGGVRGMSASVPFTADADEWRFLYIDVADGAMQTMIRGSRPSPVRTDQIGWRQMPGAMVNETCSWNLVKGGGAQSRTIEPVQTGATPIRAVLAPQQGQVGAVAVGSQPTTSGGQVGPQPVGTSVAVPTSGVTLNTGTGNTVLRTTAIAPRTIPLVGFTAAGSSAVVAPRSIALAGFTATGLSAVVAPRTIALAGFTATGLSVGVAPRTIVLSGFAAQGSAASVAPRTIPLAGFKGVGP